LFARAIHLVPTEPSYHYHLAEALLRAHDFESAIASLRRHASLAPASNYVARARTAVVIYTWGQILLDQHRFAEALDAFGEAQEMGMERESVLLRMWVASALAHVGLGQHDEAIELLYILTDANPSVDLFILRAKIYRELGNIDFVNIDLKRARVLAPDHPEIPELAECVMSKAVEYKNKASDQILKGQPTAAVHYLNHAIELDDLDTGIVFKRGVLLAEMRHHEGAIQDFLSVLGDSNADEKWTDQVQAQLASVYNRLGIEAYDKENVAAAREFFSKALCFRPNESTVLKNRADCLYLLGNIPETLADLTAALTLSPDDETCRWRCGIVHAGLGERAFLNADWARACEEYRKAVLHTHHIWSDYSHPVTQAIEYQPDSADYYYLRGKTYFQAGQPHEARDDLAKAVELDPNHAEAQATLSQLLAPLPKLPSPRKRDEPAPVEKKKKLDAGTPPSGAELVPGSGGRWRDPFAEVVIMKEEVGGTGRGRGRGMGRGRH
ncbi:hypothetical protein BDK51DRAFT_32036, partial [Blyttiomyces helicus]